MLPEAGRAGRDPRRDPAGLRRSVGDDDRGGLVGGCDCQRRRVGRVSDPGNADGE